MKRYDTLKFYDENAKIYFKQTRNGDMEFFYKKFLMLLPSNAYILDFGCGSGRDSKYFIEHGYIVKAIDGSKEMCKLASSYINQKVLCMDFTDLKDENVYDGIWACSSILHVERENLAYIIEKMIKAVKENGIIYTSFKVGNKEIIENGKYYNYISRDMLESIINQIDTNSKIIDYFENETVSSINRPKSTWGNYLIKKLHK